MTTSAVAMRSLRGRLFLGAVAAVVGAATTAPMTAPRVAPAGPAPLPLRAVGITLALEAHAKRGEMGARRASRSSRAKVGEEVEGTIGAGTLENRDICDVQVSLGGGALYLTWGVKATVRSADTERVELDLTWTRTTAGVGVTAEGSTTVTIPPGRSHLIDVVSTSPGEDRMCSHVSLLVSADRASRPTGELLVHRLWLVHAKGGARIVSEPVEAIGTVGEAVPFRFRPLRWNLDGSAVTKAEGPRIGMDIMGTVAGEPLEDGSIETLVDVKRQIRVDRVSFSGEGRMMIAGRSGEAGEVELPPAGGLGRLSADGIPSGPLAPGISRKDNRIQLDAAEFFAGSRTSLVITVERLK